MTAETGSQTDRKWSEWQAKEPVQPRDLGSAQNMSVQLNLAPELTLVEVPHTANARWYDIYVDETRQYVVAIEISKPFDYSTLPLVAQAVSEALDTAWDSKQRVMLTF